VVPTTATGGAGIAVPDAADYADIVFIERTIGGLRVLFRCYDVLPFAFVFHAVLSVKQKVLLLYLKNYCHSSLPHSGGCGNK